MEIMHDKRENNGSFFVQGDNKPLAEMVYSSRNPAVMVIEHTEVDPSLRGKNIGLQLLGKAVEYAQANNMKIKAICSFVRSVFEKHPDQYKDIIFK